MSGLAAKSGAQATALYRTVWRWHFYAGLLVVPLIVMLSITGAIYLFKPQIDRWQESSWTGLSTINIVSADAQVEAALAAVPGATFNSYRLPDKAGDAALVHVALPESVGMRDVFVAPAGNVLAVRDPDDRISAIVSDIHGSLLLGNVGGYVVELAASWAIVLIVSGLYLWWPRDGGAAGIIWPRFKLRGRVFLRDLHSVTGFWVSALALVLLVTGLPWAGVWGDAFKAVRAATGQLNGPQDWTTRNATRTGDHADHDHAAMMVGMNQTAGWSVSLSTIVAAARAEQLAFPAIIRPPGIDGRFGGAPAPGWTVQSEAQNRPLRATIRYDAMTGAETGRENFADRHVIDRAIGYGIAWHEGQLFGWINQVVGVLTALAIILVAVTGTMMWWRRRPDGVLGAPPGPDMLDGGKMRGLVVMLFGLAVLLPLLAASLLLVWLIELLVLRHLSVARRWLGLSPQAS